MHFLRIVSVKLKLYFRSNIISITREEQNNEGKKLEVKKLTYEVSWTGVQICK